MTRLRSTATFSVVALAMVLAGCGGASATTPRSSASWYPSTPLPTPGPAEASASLAATAAPPAGVGLAGSSGLGTPATNVAATGQLSFSPAAVTLTKGAVVEWKNTGSAPHNVTFDSQPALSSGTLQQGDTWQVQFTTPGTYAYHCTFHPGMNGQVTVSP